MKYEMGKAALARTQTERLEPLRGGAGAPGSRPGVSC